MPELDDDEREYLAAFAAVATPTADEVRARLADVQRRIAAGSDPSVGPLEDEGPRRGRPWVLIGAVTVALAAAAVLLLLRLDVATRLAGESSAPVPSEAAYGGREGAEAGGRAVPRVPETHSAPSSTPEAPATEDVEEPVPPEEPTTEPEIASTPAVEEPVLRRRTRAPAPEPTAPEDEGTQPAADATLHAEIALLRPAQKALRAGDHARALRLLDDHAKSFPRSVLAEERSLGRIQALCGLGRRTQAQSAIAAFVRRHPRSPLIGRVESACPAEESTP